MELIAEPAKIVIAAERFRSTLNRNDDFEPQEVVKGVYGSAISPKMSSSFGYKSLKSQIADLSDPTPRGAQPTLFPKEPARLKLTSATDYDPEDLEHRNPFNSGSDDEEDLAESDDAREHYAPMG